MDKKEPALNTKRSEEFWFEDGNVVLEVRDDHHILQFRLHRSVLSQLSPVFRDMFSIPQPETSFMVDGCLVFPLFDDVKDVQIFVSLIYNAISGPVDFETLRAMLLFGKKYQITKLRDCAIHRLQLEFSSQLDDWDLDWDRPYRLLDPAITAHKLLHLVHDHSVPVFPALYLHICIKNDIDSIISKLTNPEILINCLVGRERLFINCKESASCTKAKTKYLKRIWKRRPQKLLRFVILSWDRIGMYPDFCKPCIVAAKDAHHKARKKIWEDLPNYFCVKESDTDDSASG